MKSVAGASYKNKVRSRRWDIGEQREEDPKGIFPGKRGNIIVDASAKEFRVNCLPKRGQEGRASDYVGKGFGALGAKGADA